MEPEQDAKFFLDRPTNSNRYEYTTVAAIAFIQDGRDSPDVLHTLLHPVVGQMLLPISAAAKGILWTVLFGLAKTCQYGGLTILGVEGYNRLKSRKKRKKHENAQETSADDRKD